jgi:hypothetical protein
VLAIGGAASVAGASPATRAAKTTASRLLGSSSSSADTTPSAVNVLASTSDDIGNQFVFWKGSDGGLSSAVYTARSTSWSGAPIPVPDTATLGSEPTAVTVTVAGIEYVYVLWEGTDGGLYYDYGVVTQGTSTTATSIGSWSGPIAVSGVTSLGSKPTATYVAMGGLAGIDVFWESSSGSLFSAVLSGAGGTLSLSSGPTELGDGPVGSAPAAGSDGAGNVYVYWQGSGGDGPIYEAYYDESDSSWTGPIDLGLWTGDTASAPSVAVDSVGDQYLFWQGENGSLYYAYWNGSYWTSWIGVGFSPMGSAPSATVTVADSPASMSGFTVVWEGTDLNLWSASYSFDTESWTGPNYEPYGPLG